MKLGLAWEYGTYFFLLKRLDVLGFLFRIEVCEITMNAPIN
jgi:hypothetical protein